MAGRRGSSKWVVAAHAVAVVAVLIAGAIPSCRTVMVETVRVKLVEVPPLTQPRETPQDPPSPNQPLSPRERLRTADDIRRTTTLTPPPKTPPRQTDPPRVDPDRVAQRLEQTMRHLSASVEAPPATPDQPAVTVAQTNRYLALISAVLHRRWQQPSRAETGRGNPRVGVRLTVARNGHLVSSTITAPSGVAAMDRSVQSVLDNLRTLPPLAAAGVDARSWTFSVPFVLD